MDGGLAVKRDWLPFAFVLSLSLSLLFFLIVVRDQPLRLGEMLHLVREEILLRPSMIPTLCFLLLLLLVAMKGGWGVSLPPRPPASNTMLPLLF